MLVLDGASIRLKARFACVQHDLGRTAVKASGMVRHMMEQPGLAELREDLNAFKSRTELQIESVTGELAIVKNCIMQLYNVLLPAKLSMQHLQAAPVMPPIPVSMQHFPTPPQTLPQLQRAHHATPQHPAYPHLAAVRSAASFVHCLSATGSRIAASQRLSIVATFFVWAMALLQQVIAKAIM